MDRYFFVINCIVVLPGSRVLGPDFYLSRIPNLGSRIPDPTKAAKEEEEKTSCLTFFVATFFTKLKVILFLNMYRKIVRNMAWGSGIRI